MKSKIMFASIIIFLVTITLGCMEKEKPSKEILVNTVFEPFGYIPKKYTCDADDVSPPLILSEIPNSTKSLVIICEDIDAPGGKFIHWIAWNIEPTLEIPENIPKKDIVYFPIKMNQGKNDFGKIGYNGPCPPPGKPHRYIFNIYALDIKLEGRFDESSLRRAIENHIIGYGKIVGLYCREVS